MQAIENARDAAVSRLKNSFGCVSVCDVPRRNTSGFDLKKAAQLGVDAIAARRAMKKSDVVERALAFLAKSPDSVQSVMLGVVDRDMVEAYANALENMAAMVRDAQADEADAAVIAKGRGLKTDR